MPSPEHLQTSLVTHCPSAAYSENYVHIATFYFYIYFFVLMIVFVNQVPFLCLSSFISISLCLGMKMLVHACLKDFIKFR